MLFDVPPTTPYDVRFRLAGIPVRVHPMFWLVTAIMGAASAARDRPSTILVWIACVFVSILVHEFGHAGAAWLFGASPAVVLHAMGGLCYYADGERQSSWQRIAVLLAGPGAGFLFFGVVLGVQLILFPASTNLIVDDIFRFLLFINLAWGVINLFPVYPMDGGQIAIVAASMINRRQGRRNGHVISLVCAGLLALLAFRFGQTFVALLFGYMAFLNYQQLEAIHYSRSHLDYDDADWWKR